MAQAADFNFFLQQKNPFKKPLVGGGIGDSSVAPGQSWIYPTYDAMLKGTQWQNRQIAGNNAAGQAPTSLNGPANTSNPFTTLRNVKNEGVATSLGGVLGQINSLDGPQQDTVIRSTRNQPLADRLSKEFHNFDVDRDGNRATLADFTNNWNAAAPQTQAQTDQEVASVDEFYNGGVRGELDRLAGARRIATAGALTPAIQAVLKGRNMGALLGGNDSYLDNQVLNRAGRLSRDAAVDNAEQLKNNYLYEREGQNRFLGARAGLINNNLMRELVPTEAGQRINQNDLQRLYGIGAAENANTNYRVTNPQMELATKLGLLGDVSRIDLGNTFYGLQKPYEPNTQGFVSDPGGGGGFNFGPAINGIMGGQQPNINRVQQPMPAGVTPSTGWDQLPQEMQAQIADQGYDWGAGSYAAQSGLPGTTVVQNGRRFIRGQNGALIPIGDDGLTDAQRYYDTPSVAQPAPVGGSYPNGGGFY